MPTLWDEHDDCLVHLPDPYAIRSAETLAALNELRALRPEAMVCRRLGRSAEGREIVLATVGGGPTRALAWSQMHGDEPTHTAVLLDLLHFLQRRPDHPTAAAILEHLCFSAIVMLNPDGAERQTRHNAQGIDVNRDARALASPEARVLRQAVEELQPDFAFNLHNHNPRRTVAATGEPAAVALLTPPVDAAGSCPAHMIAAQQVASWVRQAVEIHAPGMVARYEADYMPRAFGEWVQQQGVATLLIEAGGWSTLSAERLRRLHFVAFTAALSGIATGDYRRTDISLYKSLSGTGADDLFDLTIKGCQIATQAGRERWEADLGINGPGTGLQADEVLRGAVIAAIGDLQTGRGKKTIDARGQVCVAGRIVWRRRMTPFQWPTREVQQHHLLDGVTTLLGTIDLDLPDARWQALVDALRRPPATGLLQNLGWVATSDSWDDQRTTRLATVAPLGVVALHDSNLPAEVAALVDAFQLLRVSEDRHSDRADAAVQKISLPGRSDIALGAVADLAIRESIASGADSAGLYDGDLRQVIVGGTVVLDRGQFYDVAPGVLLTRR